MWLLTKTKALIGWCILGCPLMAVSQKEANNNGEYRQVLSAVASSIQKFHYDPAAFNDELSEKWWRSFLETLDPLKQFFLQSDLSALKKYKTVLDDELRGDAPLNFLPAVISRYRIRMNEARAVYGRLLQKPFRFNENETIRYDASGLPGFAGNSDELAQSRRKYVKYLVLQELVALQEQDPHSKNEIALEAEARNKVASRLDKWMLHKTDGASYEKHFSLYLNCFTHLMDPHTSYLSAAEAKKFRDRMSNKVAGIGAALTTDEEGAKVARLESSGSAALHGIELNDVIVRLGEGTNGDMTWLAGLSSGEIANMVRGEKGSSLRLEIKKPGGKLVTVLLQRNEIDQQENAVKALIIRKQNKKIGYITFPVFYQDADPFGAQVAADVANAIQLLKGQQADAILFDLRRNGGGSLQEVVRMVSLLIKGGPVVQVRERNAAPVTRSSVDVMLPFGSNPIVQQIYDGPLAVLVDEFSASASEIFASAIQDYKRGIIIGSTSTHGKGTVQRGVPLGDGNMGTLNLTFSQFYRVNGASTQLKGVVPDIILPDLNECVRSREKDQASALSWDMVAPAAYGTWEGGMDIDALRNFALNRLESDTVFSMIKKNSAILCAQATRDIPLKMDLYRQWLKDKAALTLSNNRIIKLPPTKTMQVDLLYPVRNETWLSNVRQDIYIEQAVALAAAMCN